MKRGLSAHDTEAVPRIRKAISADAQTIATLHVASWRAAYRGILLDAFLDGPVEPDRQAIWRGRLADPAANQILLVAEQAGAIAGFLCCFADQDAHWGSYIHNLHVDPAGRGRGIGRALMGALATELDRRASQRSIYLHCLAANAPAARFYERIGGEIAARPDLPEPDGRIYPCLLYAWASPAALGARVA